MLNILRAFAWMRWRVLLNSLERTGARDTLERLSLAVEQIAPLIAAALFIPSAIALAAFAAFAGYSLVAPDNQTLPFEIVRYLLVAAVFLSIAGPIMLPASERTNAVRLLLLPVSRPVLYTAQAASAVTDPWILLSIPLILMLPLGLAAGGGFAVAVIAAMAGALLLLALLGLSSLCTTVLHLLVRDRRRGELLALVFIIVLPTLGMLPAMMNAGRDDARAERAAGEEAAPSWVFAAGRRAFSLMPSELFRSAVRQNLDGSPGAGLLPLAALAASVTALHGLALLAFGKLLDSPASTGHRRATGGVSRWRRIVPGFSPEASAVAVNQWRLVLRTPRGRSILVSPLLVFSVFAVLMWRRGGDTEFGFIALNSGLGLAVFGAAVSLLSILPFAMNQFAVDRSGLTLQFLTPLSDLDLLIGKALGNGFVALASSLICAVLAFLLFPAGPLALWLSIPPGLVATYLLAAPAAAVLSAIFPRAVDLNSIGNGSNAHGLAGLVGMLCFVLAGAPPILLTLLASSVFGRLSLAPVLVAVWCIVALVACRLLLIPAARLFARRRENIGLVVT